MVLLARNIVTAEQMGKGRELLGPGELFQHTTQVDHIVRARDRGQRWVVRPQESQPTEDMRIAAQLIERANLRMVTAEISQKVPNRSAIGRDGCIPQRSRHGFCRWPEEFRERVRGERDTFSFHDCVGGTDRMRWETARAYCSQTSCGVS